ncbi:hypothetical protein BHE74_00055751, partial [Ensete ventricosum]
AKSSRANGAQKKKEEDFRGQARGGGGGGGRIRARFALGIAALFRRLELPKTGFPLLAFPPPRFDLFLVPLLPAPPSRPPAASRDPPRVRWPPVRRARRQSSEYLLASNSSSRVLPQYDRDSLPVRTLLSWFELGIFARERLSKPDFNRYCLPILGHENIHLHNQLIRSILKNAVQAKTPPPLGLEKATLKPIEAVGKKPSQDETMVNHLAAPTPTHSVWSNGSILSPSSHKVRSCIQDRRIKDRPIPLGQNGTADAAYHQSSVPLDKNVATENGTLGPHEWKRPMQHHQGVSSEQPAKRPRAGDLTPHAQAFLESKDLVEVEAMKDAEELQQAVDFYSKRGPLEAPLGIPFCPASLGGAQRSLPLGTTSTSGSLTSNYYRGELCHSEILKKRMEKIAEAHGLEGVALDCSNLLNNGLDAYLKRLIRSCVELLGSRSGHDHMKHPFFQQQAQMKPINGVWPGNIMLAQNSSGSINHMQCLKTHPVSVQDFRIAMELNPQQLGEDWPFLLEKICLDSYEE